MSGESTPPVIAVRDAGGHVGETVCVRGWLYNLRKSGKIVFPIIRDGSGMMQDRVTALRQAIVFEPHVYRHIVGSLLVAAAPDGSYSAVSNVHILRTGADGTTITYGSGRYLDEIVRQGDKMLFRKRTVMLDSSRIDTLLVIPL